MELLSTKANGHGAAVLLESAQQRGARQRKVNKERAERGLPPIKVRTRRIRNAASGTLALGAELTPGAGAGAESDPGISGEYSCPKCDQTFSTARGVQTHLMFGHASKAKKAEFVARRSAAMLARKAAGLQTARLGRPPKNRDVAPAPATTPATTSATAPAPTPDNTPVLALAITTPKRGRPARVHPIIPEPSTNYHNVTLADALSYLELKRRWMDEVIGDLREFATPILRLQTK